MPLSRVTSDPPVSVFSGHGARPNGLSWPTAAFDDGDRSARPLRLAERYVVAAVRKRRPTQVGADHDHLLPKLDNRGIGIRADAGGRRRAVREHFRERETRFVPVL